MLLVESERSEGKIMAEIMEEEIFRTFISLPRLNLDALLIEREDKTWQKTIPKKSNRRGF